MAHATDSTVGSLPACRFSTPVRVGNAESARDQTDVFDYLDLARRGGIPASAQETAATPKSVEHVEGVESGRIGCKGISCVSAPLYLSEGDGVGSI